MEAKSPSNGIPMTQMMDIDSIQASFREVQSKESLFQQKSSWPNPFKQFHSEVQENLKNESTLTNQFLSMDQQTHPNKFQQCSAFLLARGRQISEKLSGSLTQNKFLECFQISRKSFIEKYSFGCKPDQLKKNIQQKVNRRIYSLCDSQATRSKKDKQVNFKSFIKKIQKDQTLKEKINYSTKNMEEFMLSYFEQKKDKMASSPWNELYLEQLETYEIRRVVEATHLMIENQQRAGQATHLMIEKQQRAENTENPFEKFY